MSLSKAQFVDHLNHDLELEYKSIVLYVNQIATLKGAKYQQTVDELKSHVSQEVNHAITVAQQVDFLGGTPSDRVPEFDSKPSSAASLKQDLELEKKQLERYRERMQQAEDLGLPDVAEALAPVLEETQHHLRDLRAVLAN